LISLDALYLAGYSVLLDSNIAYLFCAVALAFGTMFRRGSWDRVSILCGTAATAAMITGLAAVLKHYAEHYLLAVGAALPLAFYVAFAGGMWRWIAGLTIVVALSLSLRETVGFLDEYATKASLTNQDEADILKMPLAAGEARLWVYGLGNRQFAEAFVAHYSGVPTLIALASDPTRSDFSSVAQVKREYRYIILDRLRLPDAKSVVDRLAGFIGMKALGISPRPDDIIYSFRQTLVVKRADPLTRPGP
jgi:hypothetical protein